MGRRRIPRVTGGEPDTSDRLGFAVPAVSLDLHGYRTEEARQKLRVFLQRVARTHSGHVARVITGRGVNSPDGPKLRPMVLEELELSAEAAVRWELSRDRGSVLIRIR